MEQRKARPEEYNDALDFANYVFGIDFRSLLPKLYGTDKAYLMPCHHIIEDEGRIKALVGCFPLEQNVAGNRLLVAGIGTVSVHRYERGKGYMKALMAAAISESISNNADLMVLSGKRQRYEHFGFASCGTSMMADFFPVNLAQCRHLLIDSLSISDYDDKWLQDCCRLHDSQPVHAMRTADRFVEISTSWKNRLYIITLDAKFKGYLIASENKDHIEELLLEDSSLSKAVVLQWLKQYEVKKLGVHVMPYQIGEAGELSAICEEMRIEYGSCFRVLNYPRVLQAYLSLKNQSSPLMDGSWSFEVTGTGKYLIEVRKGEVSVTETTGSCDMVFTDIEAMNYIFSPAGSITHAGEPALIRNWFPLTIFFTEPDNV